MTSNEPLILIAKNAAQQSLCLLVPRVGTHEVVKTDSWRAAVDTIVVLVPKSRWRDTGKFILAVARSYFPQSRVGDLSHLTNDRRFLSRLRKHVEQGPCTPFGRSRYEIDMIVLG